MCLECVPKNINYVHTVIHTCQLFSQQSITIDICFQHPLWTGHPVFRFINLVTMSAADDIDEMPALEDDTRPTVTSPAASSAPSTRPSQSTVAGGRVTGADPDGDDDDDDDADDDDDEAWEEMDDGADDVPLATCLFCPLRLPASELVAHCRAAHGIDLAALVVRHALDSFGYIRLVNFVRVTEVTPQELDKLSPAAWADQVYMKPAVEDDPLLMIGERRGMVRWGGGGDGDTGVMALNLSVCLGGGKSCNIADNFVVRASQLKVRTAGDTLLSVSGHSLSAL